MEILTLEGTVKALILCHQETSPCFQHQSFLTEIQAPWSARQLPCGSTKFSAERMDSELTTPCSKFSILTEKQAQGLCP